MQHLHQQQMLKMMNTNPPPTAMPISAPEDNAADAALLSSPISANSWPVVGVGCVGVGAAGLGLVVVHATFSCVVGDNVASGVTSPSALPDPLASYSLLPDRSFRRSVAPPAAVGGAATTTSHPKQRIGHNF
jgi:hypothetical protein